MAAASSGSIESRRRFWFWMFVLSPIVFGYAEHSIKDEHLSALSIVLGQGLLYASLGAWIYYDAPIQRHLLTSAYGIFWIYAPYVASPVYLIRSRGWKYAAKLGFGLPVFIASTLAYYTGALLASVLQSGTGPR